MGKLGQILSTFIFAVIISVTLPTVIEFISTRSKPNGNMETASYYEVKDDNPGYSIKYNLDDGILTNENPTEYGLFTETFTLNNPTKEDYKFIGWTGSNGETPQVNITICKGSCGDLEFTANFALILETPIVTKTDNIITWNAIENATGYKININGTDAVSINALEYNLRDNKQYLIDGVNIVKVKAYAENFNGKQIYADGDYSESVIYSVTKLTTPNKPQSNEFLITWNEVNNAIKYKVSIGAYNIETAETSIDLLNHLDILSTSDLTTIRVQAIAEVDSDMLNSEFSQMLIYSRPKLNSVNLQLEESILTWNYQDKVETYEIYVNNVKCQTITGKSEIDIKELDAYFIDGVNSIVIKVLAKGYATVTSNTFEYTYYDLSQFDEVVLNLKFNRTSSGYSIGDGVMISESYSYDGTRKGGFCDGDLYEEGIPNEEILLKYINNLREISTLKLNVSMFELIEYINNEYSGETEKTIITSNMFSFAVKDELNTEYTPENITINVTYGTMFNETPFYENCIVNLNDCYSGNGFELVTSGQYSSVDSRFDIKADVDYKLLNYAVNGGDAYFYIYSISNSEAVSESTVNSYMADCKYYLNADYYLKLKGNFTDFYKAIYSDVCSQRNEYERQNGNTISNNFSSTQINFTLDITQYFDVYTINGEKVAFNYTLTIDCLTYGIFQIK